ncbi:MAG: molecular chaperone SurA [Woeseiaceae bacterium]|nr:molecular chaperone SurA [Woeseiaceae bacterium]
MLKSKGLRAIACVTAVFAAPPGLADELSATGEFLDGIAAIVDDGVVLKSQLASETALIIERASQQDPPIPLPPANVLREQVLERLIVKEIQLQRAARIGLQISDEMLNQAIGNIAQANGVAFEDMPELLAADGISYSEFRRDMRDELTLDQLRRIDVGQRISVSPREIEKCIADLEGNVAAESDYNLSHILISIPESATTQQVDEALEEAQDIYRQLQDGADFRELALRYSDAQTALEGGSLGWMKGEQMPTIYTDVVIDLESGGVSEPFRSASSFHIVKVNEVRSAIQRSEINQANVRHILITPDEIIDDATAKQQLGDALERIAAGEDFAEIAKLMSDDPGTGSLGGELGWAGPGTYAPEFEETISNTDVGEISQPFRTVFGWHILEVLGRRVYDNTEDLKRGNCVNRVRNSKIEDETQLWIRRLRDEAFVDTRV